MISTPTLPSGVMAHGSRQSVLIGAKLKAPLADCEIDGMSLARNPDHDNSSVHEYQAAGAYWESATAKHDGVEYKRDGHAVDVHHHTSGNFGNFYRIGTHRDTRRASENLVACREGAAFNTWKIDNQVRESRGHDFHAQIVSGAIDQGSIKPPIRSNMSDIVVKDPRGYDVVIHESTVAHAHPHHDVTAGRIQDRLITTVSTPDRIISNTASFRAKERSGDECYVRLNQGSKEWDLVPAQIIEKAEKIHGYGTVSAGSRRALTVYSKPDMPLEKALWVKPK